MFSEWLKKELKNLKIDVLIYHDYLIGILEDSIDENEKREMITDIISSLVENDTELFINTLFEKWLESQGPIAESSKNVKQEPVDIAKLLETQAKISLQSGSRKNREISEEERRIKEQILLTYSQTEASRNGDEEEEGSDDESDDPNFEKNTNKLDVQKLAREKREQNRLDSAAKKQKDKEDRAKQKATREEKKSNRKAAAVKGERKR